VCLDGSLGNIKIASYFRVITTLEQQLNNLPFPGSNLFKFFFHKAPAPDRYVRCTTIDLQVSGTHLDWGVSQAFCIHTAKRSLETLSVDEIVNTSAFSSENPGDFSNFREFYAAYYSGFAQFLR
jgi:hypothetical protein